MRYDKWRIYNGTQIDTRRLITKTAVVDEISLGLLNIIAELQSLRILTGDIKNNSIQESMNEKVFTQVGPELSELREKLIPLLKPYIALPTS